MAPRHGPGEFIPERSPYGSVDDSKFSPPPQLTEGFFLSVAVLELRLLYKFGLASVM